MGSVCTSLSLLQSKHLLISFADVHAAKDFRVSWILKRQETSNDLGLSSPPVPTSPVSSTRVELGFRVPDDDDSSVEVRASREDSVQVVESQVNTYSVPSSDDEVMICSDSEIDDDGMAKSVQSQEEEESAVTTPESKSSGRKGVKTGDETAPYTEAKKAEYVELLNMPNHQDFPMAPIVDLTETAPKKDLAGSSQKFPLDLRDRSPTPFPCDDTESEHEPDDGPEVWHSKIHGHKSPSPLIACLNQPFTGKFSLQYAPTFLWLAGISKRLMYGHRT